MKRSVFISIDIVIRDHDDQFVHCEVMQFVFSMVCPLKVEFVTLNKTLQFVIENCLD